MAHEFESGFTVGQRSWHELETNVETPPHNGAEARKLAGLDWTVSTVPIYILGADGKPVEVPHGMATVRSSDQRILGNVGPSWTPLQNAELTDWFDPFTENGTLTWETAGSLRGGQLVWGLCKFSGVESEVVKGDAHELYLLFSNAHDGSRTIDIIPTDVRVVCRNTHRLAIETGERAGKTLKIRHYANVAETVRAVQPFFDAAQRRFALTMEQYRAMAARQLDVDGLKQFVRTVFLDPAETDAPMPRAWGEIERNFSAGFGAEFHRGTVYGALNAVSEWTDHQRGKDAGTRTEAQLFGFAATIKEKAHAAALALV